MVQQNYACTPQLLHAECISTVKLCCKNESSYWKDLQKTCRKIDRFMLSSHFPTHFPCIFQASKLARFGSDWPLFLDRFWSMPSATANCSCPKRKTTPFDSRVLTLDILGWCHPQVQSLMNWVYVPKLVSSQTSHSTVYIYIYILYIYIYYTYIYI